MTRSLAELLAAFPSFGEAMPGLERAAASDAPVLIVGEPGSGRSTLGRALHGASRRRDHSLVEVDPVGFPPSLFESEFFGYRAGAFTGAERDLPGRVARAEGGTLLLDHVEEIPVPAQPKLLRLVAERRFAPLGGDERTADVRFVAIGSQELPERVRRGTFRADLFFRLEVLTFRVAPLRERRAELEAVVAALLADLCPRLGLAPRSLSSTARSWMESYSWPGNLRQLRNLLERELVLGGRGALDPPPPAELLADRPRSLVEVETEEIRRALAYTRGHQGRAAAVLGISRKSLWEKRRRYGIP